MDATDLQPGMVVTSSDYFSPVFVVEANFDLKDDYWEGKYFMRFLSAEDSYSGVMSREIREDEKFLLVDGEKRDKIFLEILEQLTSTESHIRDSIAMIKIAMNTNVQSS